MYIYSYLFCLCVRTTATEWKLNYSIVVNDDDDDDEDDNNNKNLREWISLG
jgi:hypothetical protein